MDRTTHDLGRTVSWNHRRATIAHHGHQAVDPADVVWQKEDQGTPGGPGLLEVAQKSVKVMEHALEPLGRAIAAMKHGPEASPQLIAGLLLSMAAQHPNIPRLLTREVLLPGGQMLQYFSDNMAPHLGGALPGLLDREKSAGRMRQDADSAISAVLILALCVFPFVARTLAEPMLGIKFDDKGIELLNRQITELLQRGMVL